MSAHAQTPAEFDDPWGLGADEDTEAALAALLADYPDFVMMRLRECRDLLAPGLLSDGVRLGLRGVAHDLRGEGTSFGYPAVTRIAQALGGVLRQAGADGPALLRLVEDHLAAIERIVCERLRGDNPAAIAACLRLEQKARDLFAAAAPA